MGKSGLKVTGANVDYFLHNKHPDCVTAHIANIVDFIYDKYRWEKFFITTKEVTVNSRADKDDRREIGKGEDNRQ